MYLEKIHEKLQRATADELLLVLHFLENVIQERSRDDKEEE